MIARGLLGLLVALTALPALPASASAQQAVSIGFLTPGREISTTQIPASVSGEVSLDFQPDTAGGCAALSACSYRGRLLWDPGGPGGVQITKYRQGGRAHLDTEFFFGTGNGPGSISAATVQRGAGGQTLGTCGDGRAGLGGLSGVQRGGQTVLTLEDELSPGRCAGPLAVDLAGISPSVTLATARLLRGELSLSFATQRRFSAHGFAGTLTSTLVLRLGRPHTQPAPSSLPFPPGTGTRKIRYVSEALKAVAAAGTLTAAVSGTRSSDVCVLLDSCGVAGTLSIAPKPAGSRGQFTAIGPASRPLRDYLTALGLSRAGRSTGIQVAGFVQWDDRGTVSADVRQSASCTDTAALGGGAAALQIGGGNVTVGYLAAGTAVAGAASLRTRCPGPLLSSSVVLATGSVPRARLRDKRFTVQLRPAGPVSDQGYDVAVHGSLSLSFHAGRVTEQIQTVPGG